MGIISTSRSFRQKSRKSARLLLPIKERIIKNIQRRPQRPQDCLGGELRWGRFVGDKGELEVADDPVHHGIVGEKGDDPHRAAALRADERVHLIDFADHLGPAFRRDRLKFLLDNQERGKPQARLARLSSMGVGVDAVVSQSHLAFVGNMGGVSIGMK